MADGLDAGLSSLDFFVVNFEPFCGDIKPVVRPGSSKKNSREEA